MLTIDATAHIGFNIHTFSPANYDGAHTRYIWLKRNSGVLRTGDFAVSSLQGVDGGPARGQISLGEDTVVIDVEMRQFDSYGQISPEKWVKAEFNGEYGLIRD
jgi:hypothetical protein